MFNLSLSLLGNNACGTLEFCLLLLDASLGSDLLLLADGFFYKCFSLSGPLFYWPFYVRLIQKNGPLLEENNFNSGIV